MGKKITFLMLLPFFAACSQNSPGLFFRQLSGEAVSARANAPSSERQPALSRTAFQHFDGWGFECEYLGASSGSDQVPASAEEEYAGNTAFRFTISRKGYGDELLKKDIRSSAEYQERVSYYSFHFSKDVYVVLDRDTIPCSFSHLERLYGLAPRITMSLVFRLVAYDRVFGQGLIKFQFDPKN
jgi:hypothetical protein